MTIRRSIAIDGSPDGDAADLARQLAERLELPFLNSHHMYRACTVAILNEGIEDDDTTPVGVFIRGLDLGVRWSTPATPRYFLFGEDITESVMSPVDGEELVRRNPEVRRDVELRQRAIARRRSIVLLDESASTTLALANLKVEISEPTSANAPSPRVRVTLAPSALNQVGSSAADLITVRDAVDSLGDAASQLSNLYERINRDSSGSVRTPGKSDEVAASSPPPFTRGSWDETTDDGDPRYPVWFVTNRKAKETDDGFTSAIADHVTRGRVLVTIPKSHQFGGQSMSRIRRLVPFGRRPSKFQVSRPTRLNQQDFAAELREMMRSLDADARQPNALFYIHGYCTTFEQAAVRAAQLGRDLKVTGPTGFFSWPSRGTKRAYPPDEASISASEAAITESLVEFVRTCGEGRVDIIAHSMGNQALLRAVQRILGSVQLAPGVLFRQVIFAAPDVDARLFGSLAPNLVKFAHGATMYASDADLALAAAVKVFQAPRAGYFEPYTITPGVDTVAVPDFNVDLLGHSYYARAEGVLQDIFEILHYETAPLYRQRTEPLATGAGQVWQIRR